MVLGSCSDDTPSSATTDGGTSSGGAAAGMSAGGTTAGRSNAGTSGGVSAGSSAGGAAGSAGASAGSGGGGQASGGGGSGGTSGGGGNGGSGGAPRVYTIEGCDEPGAGGAGGEGNSGGEGNAGGNSGVPAGGAGEGGAGSIIPAISASFTVYDFVTDKPVQTCVDRVNDFDITITGDAPLTVAANLPPGLMPGSVLWTYDGTPIMPHNIFPYTLGPDDNGDYQEPTPPLTAGEHVLTITVYADADAMGAVLGQTSITITVVEG